VNDWVVVDTNVLLVAEGRSSYTLACKANCGKILEDIKSKRTVVLDSAREILSEYGNKLAEKKGQPGLGYEFWKWLVNTRLSHDHCEVVRLTKNIKKGYEEFPDHEGLKAFDPSDRKFVAVAAVHPKRPKIIQAGDSKWWGWRESLSECGIELHLPCEAELRAKWEAKIAKHA
jgi:predicted nucleic acid-binding protein